MYVTITETKPDGTEITESVRCVSVEDFNFDYERSQLPVAEVVEHHGPGVYKRTADAVQSNELRMAFFMHRRVSR